MLLCTITEHNKEDWCAADQGVSKCVSQLRHWTATRGGQGSLRHASVYACNNRNSKTGVKARETDPEL